MLVSTTVNFNLEAQTWTLQFILGVENENLKTKEDDESSEEEEIEIDVENTEVNNFEDKLKAPTQYAQF